MKTSAYSLHLDTGEIVSVMTVTGSANTRRRSRRATLDAGPYAGYVGGRHDGRTTYVLGEKPTPRPAQRTSLDGLTLRDLPAPCAIIINGQEYQCVDTVAELDLAGAAMYHIRVRAWPHMDWECTVENPAP